MQTTCTEIKMDKTTFQSTVSLLFVLMQLFTIVYTEWECTINNKIVDLIKLIDS